MNRTNAKPILLLCFFTYLTVYILRVNFSSAMPLISDQLHVSNALLGAMGSAFFITYAIGQLVNGFIADSVSPFKFVILGLVGTIGANWGISLCRHFVIIIVLWACNGYFQSIFWASLTRILSFYFDKSKHSMVATTMSSSMVGGFIVSWVVLARLLGDQSWDRFFFVPALLGTLLLCIWIFTAQKARNIEIPRQQLSISSFKNTVKFMIQNKMYLFCLICFCLGFVKESISVWGPTITGELLGVDIKSSAFILLLIPIANLCGMLLSKMLIDRFKGNEIRTLVSMYGCMALGGGLLFLFKDHLIFATILLLAEISAMSYGCNSILLSFIPLAFSKYNLVSTLVGIFDFSSYIGASISSLVVGAVLINGNWTSVAFLWMLLSVLAISLCFLAKKKAILA